MNIDYNKCEEAVQELREKRQAAQEELKKQQDLVEHYNMQIKNVWEAEIARQYAQPYIPEDEEDETPDSDHNVFQGREDDEHITSQRD